MSSERLSPKAPRASEKIKKNHREGFIAIYQALKRSKFRSSFRLTKTDISYIDKVGIRNIESHAEDFIAKRLTPANPPNDGRQTPFNGHPVFKAQHATATCCRRCLSKWHKIPFGMRLSKPQVIFIKAIIIAWIKEQLCGR